MKSVLHFAHGQVFATAATLIFAYLLEQAEEHHALPPLKSEVEARALHLPRRAPRLAVFAER